MSHAECGKWVRDVAGHCKLNKYLSRKKEEVSVEEFTDVHVICECPKFLEAMCFYIRKLCLAAVPVGIGRIG